MGQSKRKFDVRDGDDYDDDDYDDDGDDDDDLLLMIKTFPLRAWKWIRGQSSWKSNKSVVNDDDDDDDYSDDDGDNDGDDDEEREMITSWIMISFWDDNWLPYDTKKRSDNGDLARRLRPTDQRTNRLIEMRGRT